MSVGGSGGLTEDYYLSFGKEKVFLKKEEVDEIRKIQDIKEFTLLGFKPLSSLKSYHNLRTSVFIYPDNEQVRNSSIFCDAMIKELHQTRQIAICRFKPSQLRSYRFCALLPQLESNSDGLHSPPGFNMVIIPFSEEIRQVEEDYFGDLDLAIDKLDKSQEERLEERYLAVWEKMKTEKKCEKEFKAVDSLRPEDREHYLERLLRETKEEQVISRELIEAFTIDDFHPNYFENPEIQKFYKNLQALALNHEHVEQVEDQIQPDEEGLQMNKDIIDHFTRVFDLAGQKRLPRPVKVNGKQTASLKSRESKLGKKRVFGEDAKNGKSSSRERIESEDKKTNIEPENSNKIVEEDIFLSDSL